MTDRYANIRRALAMGPTQGPWSVRYDYVVQGRSFDEGRLVPIAQPYGVRMDGGDLFANAALIAACDPDTIRELLAERDALQAEVERLRCIISDIKDWDCDVRGGFLSIPVDLRRRIQNALAAYRQGGEE